MAPQRFAGAAESLGSCLLMRCDLLSTIHAGYLAWAHELDCIPLWMVVVVEHFKDVEVCTCRYVAQGECHADHATFVSSQRCQARRKGVPKPVLEGLRRRSVLVLPNSGWVSA